MVFHNKATKSSIKICLWASRLLLRSRPVLLRAPAVFRLVSEDFSRFVDGQQGFVWPERPLMGNTREDLS